MINLLNSKNLSGLFKLNLKDLFKGIILSVLSSVIDALIIQLPTGEIDKQQLVIVAITSFLSYINIRFFSNENGDLLKK